MLTCDWCSRQMPTEETGIFCLTHEEGGHASCGYTHFSESHD